MDLTQSFSKGAKQYERIGLYFKYVTPNSSISIQISKEAVVLVAGVDFVIATTMEQTAQNYIDALSAALVASDDLKYYSLNRVFDVARVRSLRAGKIYEFLPTVVDVLNVVSTFEGAIIDADQNIIDYPEVANDDGTLVVDFYPAGALDMAILSINGENRQVTSARAGIGDNTDFPTFALDDYTTEINAYYNFGTTQYIEAHRSYLEHQFIGRDRELRGGEEPMPNRVAEFEADTGIVGLDMPDILEIDIIDGEGNPAVYSSYYPQRLYTEVKSGDSINLKIVGGIHFVKTGYSFRTRLVKNVVNDIRVLALDIDSYVNYHNWKATGISESGTTVLEGMIPMNLDFWHGSLNDGSSDLLSEQDLQKIEWYKSRLNTKFGVNYEIFSIEVVTGVLDSVNNPNNVSVRVCKNATDISDIAIPLITGVTDLTPGLDADLNVFTKGDRIDIKIASYSGSNAVGGGVVQIVLKPV